MPGKNKIYVFGYEPYDKVKLRGNLPRGIDTTFTAEFNRAGRKALERVYDEVEYVPVREGEFENAYSKIPEGANIMFMDHAPGTTDTKKGKLFGIPVGKFSKILKTKNPSLCAAGTCYGVEQLEKTFKADMPLTEFMFDPDKWEGFDINKKGMEALNLVASEPMPSLSEDADVQMTPQARERLGVLLPELSAEHRQAQRERAATNQPIQNVDPLNPFLQFKKQEGGPVKPRLDPVLPNPKDADTLYELSLIGDATYKALKNINTDSISYRTNNPFNITDRVGEAIGFEQPKDGDAPIAMFDSLATGIAASIRKFKNHQLGRSKWAKPDMTIEEYQKTYATSPDSFKTFQKAAKNHGYDIKADDKFGEVMDNMGMEDWLRTMMQKENRVIYKELSQPGIDIFSKVTDKNYREFLKQEGGTVESLIAELSKHTSDPNILGLFSQFQEFLPDMQRRRDTDLLNINQFRVQPTRGFRFQGGGNIDINKYGGMAKHKKKYETGGDVNIDDSMAVSMLPFSNFPFPVAEQFGTIREQILNSGVQGMNRGGVALPDTINNTMGNLYNNLSKDILGSVQPDQGFVYDKQIASGVGDVFGNNASVLRGDALPSITNFQDGGFTSALMVDDTDDIRDMLLNEYKAFKYEEGGAVNDEYAYIPIQFGDGGPVEIYGVEKAFLGKLVKGIGKGIGKIGKGIGKGLGKVGGVLSDVAGFASPFVGMIPGVGAALGPALGAIGGIGDYFQGGQGGIGKLFGNIAKGAGKGVLGNIGGGKGMLGGLLNKGGIGAMLKGGEGNFLGNILGGGQEGGLLGNITNMFSGGQGGGQGGGLADIIGGLLGGGNQQQESPLQYATPGFGGAMSAFNMGLSGGDSLMQNLMGALAPNLQFQLTRQGGFIYQDGGMVQQPQLVPIQTETVNGRSEMIIHLDGGITKVNATKPHKSMKKDEVTDIVPQGTFIASADKKMKMSYKDADKITMGIKTYQYKEGKQARVPERISMAGLWGGSRRDMTPAELTEKVRRKYNIIDKDEYYDVAGDVFTERTNQENLASRAPYLAEIIKFNQEKKNGKGGGSVTAVDMGMDGLPSLPMFKHGGPVYMNDLDHAKFGKFLGKVGSFLGKKVLPAVGKAFAPKTSGASPFEIFGGVLGTGLGTAGTLQQLGRMRGAYGTALDELATLGGQQRTGIDKMTAANLAGILGQDTRAERIQLDPAIQRLEGVRDPTTSRAYIDALSTPSYDISALAGLGGRGAASAIAQMASDQMRQRNQTLAQTAAGQRDFNLKKASAVSGLLGQQALSDQQAAMAERLARNQQLMGATGQEAQRQRMLMEQLGQEYGQRTGLTFGQAQLQSPLQAIGQGLVNAASMSRLMRSPLESLVQNYQPTQTPPTQDPPNYNPLGDWRSRMRTLGQFKIG